jgi:hypothetical protein
MHCVRANSGTTTNSRANNSLSSPIPSRSAWRECSSPGASSIHTHINPHAPPCTSDCNWISVRWGGGRAQPCKFIFAWEPPASAAIPRVRLLSGCWSAFAPTTKRIRDYEMMPLLIAQRITRCIEWEQIAGSLCIESWERALVLFHNCWVHRFHDLHLLFCCYCTGWSGITLW